MYESTLRGILERSWDLGVQSLKSNRETLPTQCRVTLRNGAAGSAEVASSAAGEAGGPEGQLWRWQEDQVLSNNGVISINTVCSE